MSLFAGIDRWDLIVMFVLFGLMFTFEMLGVFSPHLVTITQILKSFMPMPVRFMVYAWLGWHFIVSDLIRQLTPSK